MNVRSFYFGDMPRVSESHLAARRQQILDAARICFLRNGFHQTSMQDVIAQAGMSVGAVYRYFPSKAEIVEAIAEQYAGQIGAAIAALAERDAPLARMMEAAVDIIDENTGPDGPMRLAVQVWSEALRDERIGAMAAGVYTRFRDNFVAIAERAVRTGELPRGTDTTAAGAALFSLVLGYGLQKMLTGRPDRRTYRRGLRAVLPAAPASLPAG
jgi:AcrR family transcriptional regulator